MDSIEIFTDIGSIEEEINEKYPQENRFNKIYFWIFQNKNLLIVICLLLILYLLNNNNNTNDNPIIINQTGGGWTKLASPVSSTFGLVTSIIGKLFSILMLLITIILIPTLPIVLYCLVAYYIIRKFLFMVTSIR